MWLVACVIWSSAMLECRGYGIVTFGNEQDLAAAIQGAHGAVVGDPGRIVSVRQDQHM